MLSFDAGLHDITAVCFSALGYEVVDSKITVTPSATEHRGVIGIWCAVLPPRKNTEIVWTYSICQILSHFAILGFTAFWARAAILDQRPSRI